MNPAHLVQLGDGTSRCVALVNEPNLLLLEGVTSVYEMAQRCLAEGQSLAGYARALASNTAISYEDVYNGLSPWRLLAPIDVPDSLSRVLVSGTGLTHLGSARERQAMHLAGQSPVEEKPEVLTDSMRMFQWGVEGGRPAAGATGTAPEWFYKGDGSVVRAPFEPLDIPRVRRGRRRRSGARRRLSHRPGRPALPARPLPGQRVLRSPVRATQLSKPRRLQAPCLLAGP